MARRTLKFTATEGRDAGKQFVITEMSAAQAEAWAMRAFIALMREGVNIPGNIQRATMADIARIGLECVGSLSWANAEPLLQEMLDCCQYQPDPKKPQLLREILDEDIEEIKTRLQLRAAVWELHTDFLRSGSK